MSSHKHNRFKLVDILGIAAVVAVVGSIAIGLTLAFIGTVGPECMVIHCVKVIR